MTTKINTTNSHVQRRPAWPNIEDARVIIIRHLQLPFRQVTIPPGTEGIVTESAEHNGDAFIQLDRYFPELEECGNMICLEPAEFAWHALRLDSGGTEVAGRSE
jgi:hypothetical protein